MTHPFSTASVRRALLPLSLLAVLPACSTVGPDYRPPQPAPVVLQGAAAGGIDRHSSLALWWGQFDDPVLDRLMRHALAGNVDLYLAMARVREARAAFAGQQHAGAAQLQLQGSALRSQQAAMPEQVPERFELGFDARWELDLFGRQARALEAAQASVQAQREDLADAQVVLAAEVARHYFQLRSTQSRLDLAAQSRQALEQTLAITRARREEGAGSEAEVQASLAQLAALDAQLPVLELAAIGLRHRLAVLAGQRPGSLDTLLQPAPLAGLVAPLPVGEIDNVLAHRADVRAAERRLAAATAQVGVATAELYPRIRLGGFVGFLSGDAAGLLQHANRAWTVGPSLSWPAFALGSVRARLRASQARADAAAAHFEQTVLLALEETENALSGYGLQQRRLLALATQAQAAQRAHGLVRLRYLQGSEAFVSVLDAQRVQLQADDALAQAQGELNVAVVAVYKALGGLGSSGSSMAAQVSPPVGPAIALAAVSADQEQRDAAGHAGGPEQ